MSTIYIHAELKIRTGGYERFCVQLAKMKAILESNGMRLVGAWVTRVGRVLTVIDLWEVPDANTYFEATSKMRLHPTFPEIRAEIAELIEEEMITMLEKASYSP